MIVLSIIIRFNLGVLTLMAMLNLMSTSLVTIVKTRGAERKRPEVRANLVSPPS